VFVILYKQSETSLSLYSLNEYKQIKFVKIIDVLLHLQNYVRSVGEFCIAST
jgi:hypothetical protein